MIYLDNAATTFPKPECVYEAMDKMNREGAVNAGRGSYKLARKASALISETKDMLRKLVHVDSNVAVVFSPSITIAINQIINGIQIRDRAVVYVSPYEHNAVARSIHNISKERNIIVKELPLNADLEIDIEKIKYEFIKDKPEVVICTHVSNVTGYILPIKEIFCEAKKYGSINILDSAQSLGLIDVRADLLDVDYIAFAGHKTLYGPLGVGGFIKLSKTKLNVFVAGGTGSDSLNLDMPDDDETKYEAASKNIVSIAGLNAALKWINQEELLEYEHKLTEYLINKLTEIKFVKLYVPANRSSHVGIVSFSIDGMNSEDVGMILDEDFDIAVRTGYHCAPYIHKFLKDEDKLGTVRLGLGRFNNTEDIDKLCEAIKELGN